MYSANELLKDLYHSMNPYYKHVFYQILGTSSKMLFVYNLL